MRQINRSDYEVDDQGLLCLCGGLYIAEAMLRSNFRADNADLDRLFRPVMRALSESAKVKINAFSGGLGGAMEQFSVVLLARAAQDSWGLRHDGDLSAFTAWAQLFDGADGCEVTTDEGGINRLLFDWAVLQADDAIEKLEEEESNRREEKNGMSTPSSAARLVWLAKLASAAVNGLNRSPFYDAWGMDGIRRVWEGDCVAAADAYATVRDFLVSRRRDLCERKHVKPDQDVIDGKFETKDTRDTAGYQIKDALDWALQRCEDVRPSTCRHRLGINPQQWKRCGFGQYEDVYAAGKALGLEDVLPVPPGKEVRKHSLDGHIIEVFHGPYPLAGTPYLRAGKSPSWRDHYFVIHVAPPERKHWCPPSQGILRDRTWKLLDLVLRTSLNEWEITYRDDLRSLVDDTLVATLGDDVLSVRLVGRLPLEPIPKYDGPDPDDLLAQLEAI